MRRLVLFIAGGVLAGALSAASDPTRTFDGAVPIEPGSAVEVGLKVGEMEVETAAVDEVRVEVTATCRPQSQDKCLERLERLQVESTTADEGMAVWVGGVSKRYSKMEVKARFIVPQDSALAVRMYAGELRVEGGGQDIAVRLKFGEVTVNLPAEAMKSVVADANIGDAEIYAATGETDPSRPLLVGSKVSWEDGTGDAQALIKVSTGSITVHLD